jgi:uncharacterized membrane protein
MALLVALIQRRGAGLSRPSRRSHRLHDERGMTTAELLGNAALGILALVAIWTALRLMGLNVITWIGQQLGVG